MFCQLDKKEDVFKFDLIPKKEDDYKSFFGCNPKIDEIKIRIDLTRKEHGGNIEISGIQDTGKTLSMVALANHFYYEKGYPGENFIGNVKINNIPGYKFVSNQKIREWIDRIYHSEIGDWTDMVILVDEIDGLYSHRDVNDKKMNDEIKGLYQDIKLGNYFIYTDHQGLSVNKLVRDVTEITIMPDYDREINFVSLYIINGLYTQVFYNGIENASKYIPLYNRYAVVK